MADKPDKAQEMVQGAIERLVLLGDLSRLSEEQRVVYAKQVCDSMGLNWLTQPFQYTTLNGKLVLYAAKGAAEQLRKVHNISILPVAREVSEGVYVVTVKAVMRGRSTFDGNVPEREDTAIGAVHIEGLKGEARANAMMKAETKAKRRATLSMVGLGMLDESEVEDIPRQSVRVEVAEKKAAALAPASTNRDLLSYYEALTKECHSLSDIEVVRGEIRKAIQRGELTPDDRARLSDIVSAKRAELEPNGSTQSADEGP